MVMLHCSKFPRYYQCPQSKFEPELPLTGPENPAAALGSAFHEVMAFVAHNDIHPDVTAIAAKYENVDAEELALLTNIGLKAWMELKNYTLIEVEKKHEIEDSGYIITGTPDAVLAKSDHELVIVDYKTGDDSRDYKHQLMGYAHLIMRDNSMRSVFKAHGLTISKVILMTIFVRQMYIDVKEIEKHDLIEWEETALKRITDDSDYQPGAACIWCNRKMECPARATVVRASLAEFGVEKHVNFHDMTPAQVQDVRDKISIVEDAIGRITALMKLAAKERPLPCGAGHLVIEESERETILTSKALQVAGEYTGREEKDLINALLPEMSLSKKALMDIIKKSVPAGMKIGKYLDNFAEKLRLEGAVRKTKYDRMIFREPRKEKKDDKQE